MERTGELFGVTSLDEDWVTLNQMIKYYKFGFGRVTDYVNEEIRLGRMSRDYGISLVEQHDDAWYTAHRLPAAARSSARWPLKMLNIARFPSWQAYSNMP